MLTVGSYSKIKNYQTETWTPLPPRGPDHEFESFSQIEFHMSPGPSVTLGVNRSPKVLDL